MNKRVFFKKYKDTRREEMKGEYDVYKGVAIGMKSSWDLLCGMSEARVSVFNRDNEMEISYE